MRIFVLVVLGLLGSSPALGNPATIQGDFEELKRLDVDYRIEGAACEQVSKRRLEREFSPRVFETVTGISYGDHTRTIGELDVVVFDRRTGFAVLVAEVKCWENLPGARKKAAEQQKRFQEAVGGSEARRLFFASTSRPGIQYRPEQFMRNPRLMTISQLGGRRAGFDRELDHTLPEFKHLREVLLECHQRNSCVWR